MKPLLFPNQKDFFFFKDMMKRDEKALTIIYPIIDEGNFEKISRQPSLRKSGKYYKIHTREFRR